MKSLQCPYLASAVVPGNLVYEKLLSIVKNKKNARSINMMLYIIKSIF